VDKYWIETADKDRAQVVFTSPLFAWEWNELKSHMAEMLKSGVLHWEFRLRGLDVATSTDIGMWVACNAAVETYRGNLTFSVVKDSIIHRTLVFTKLDRILNVRFTEPGSGRAVPR
jgi:hypothetical protein